jgi:hypothetical protein
MDQAGLALNRLEHFLAALDPDRYSDEEAARIFDLLKKMGDFATAKMFVAMAWAPTNEARFSERLRDWLVSEQH